MIYQLDKCSVGHFLTVCFFFFNPGEELQPNVLFRET